MKTAIYSLLGGILLLVLVNVSIGVLLLGRSGGGERPRDYEYKSMSSAEMDAIGFRAIAREEGVEEGEKGEFTFSKEAAPKLAKHAMLSRTIREVEKDGGWSFVAVTSDNYFIFRR